MKTRKERLIRDFKNLKNIRRTNATAQLNYNGYLNKEYEHLVNPKMDPELAYKRFFRSQEFSVFSQNGEDGILLSLFNEINFESYTAVEFGTGNGRECNTANLILNYGLKTLLLEGDKSKALSAQKYYKNYPVSVVHEFLTRDNINDLISDNGFSGKIDLLSVDIDGNDYWLWQAIDVIKPRVVVVEYNASFGQERALTVPYDPKFNRFNYHKTGLYHGMSLAAAVKLGRNKNYHYIGCDSMGVNAFFVDKDEVLSNFKATQPSQFFESQKLRDEKFSIQEQQSVLGKFKYEEV